MNFPTTADKKAAHILYMCSKQCQDPELRNKLCRAYNWLMSGRDAFYLDKKSIFVGLDNSWDNTFWAKKGFTVQMDANGYYNLFAPNGSQIGWGLPGIKECMQLCRIEAKTYNTFIP